jgi:hypothetical protein
MDETTESHSSRFTAIRPHFVRPLSLEVLTEGLKVAASDIPIYTSAQHHRQNIETADSHFDELSALRQKRSMQSTTP